MSANRGHPKDGPSQPVEYARDNKDTEPLEPVEPVAMEPERWDVDGWKVGEELLVPDEGPTVVDGDVEEVFAGAQREAASRDKDREPARTFMGMGPSDSLTPPVEAEPEFVAVIAPPAPAEPAPSPPPEPEEQIPPQQSVSTVEPRPFTRPPPGEPAPLSAEMAFKDTMPGELDDLRPGLAPVKPRPGITAQGLPDAPLPAMAAEDLKAKLPSPLEATGQHKPGPGRPPGRKKTPEPRPTPPPTEPRLTSPPRGLGEPDLAHARTLAPTDEAALIAHAATLAPYPDAGLPTLSEAAAPPVDPRPEPPPPPPPEPSPPSPKPAARPAAPGPEQTPPAKAKGPSNVVLIILWLLALVAVTVAVALYLLRPSI